MTCAPDPSTLNPQSRNLNRKLYPVRYEIGDLLFLVARGSAAGRAVRCRVGFELSTCLGTTPT